MAHPLKQTSLLAQVRNARTIIMRKELVPKNSICNLRRMNQIHLQQSRLQMCLLRLVILERIQQKARRLLNHILTHEDIHHALDIDQWPVLVIGELGREFGALFGVDAHDVLQEGGVIRGETNFLRV